MHHICGMNEMWTFRCLAQKQESKHGLLFGCSICAPSAPLTAPALQSTGFQQHQARSVIVVGPDIDQIQGFRAHSKILNASIRARLAMAAGPLRS